MNPEALNSRELCLLFGLTPAEMAQLVKDGVPCERTGGVRSPLRFNSVSVHQFLIERAQFEGDPEALHEAKRRDREAAAELKECKLAEIRNQTITRADALAIYSVHVGEFRSRLFEIPAAVSDLTPKQRAELEHGLDCALAEFSGLPEPDAPLPSGDDLVSVGTSADVAEDDFG
jgi:hypothetical protein